MSNFPVTRADMSMMTRILSFTTPAAIPLQFCVGEKVICGVPDSFSPTVSQRLLTANTVQYIIEGERKDGLHIRVEYLEYRDFPVTEWVAWISNRGNADTPVLSHIQLGGVLGCPSPILEHGTGDTCTEAGYHFTKESVDHTIRLTPASGTSCQGAFPYMTLHGADCEIRAAIGWPTKWAAEFAPCEQGVIFSCGQDRCHTVLHPGETFRTPRLNLMIYTNDNAPYRGINLWRSWYFKHILPRENGQPIPPKLCMHLFMADGKPEFTGASEQNQIEALQTYLSRGVKPDVWWLDAGWYPCDYDWPRIGTWRPDPARFPNGLTPLGKACEDHGVQLLLWFEPERVRGGEELDREHPDWLLSTKDADGNPAGDRLLNLADPDALHWLIEHVDALIKESHVHIYRQDFNFDPLPIWVQNEAEDRIGILENGHAQGYLAYWDALILRNPGLWIDSCASGGRRNDFETMRRAVTLHYTDVGYGKHPIKQKQHREMFEWIPYFRAHNQNWDNPADGSYEGGGRPTDEYAYHCALTPALTDMLHYQESEAMYDQARRMVPIWREAAELELSGDYFPMTECRCDPKDFYAMQFDEPTTRRGFVQIIRNTQTPEDTYLVKLPCVHDGATYTMVDRQSGITRTFTADTLRAGFTMTLPLRSGVILFYQY